MVVSDGRVLRDLLVVFAPILLTLPRITESLFCEASLPRATLFPGGGVGDGGGTHSSRCLCRDFLGINITNYA
jgi:hypothetical protein